MGKEEESTYANRVTQTALLVPEINSPSVKVVNLTQDTTNSPARTRAQRIVILLSATTLITLLVLALNVLLAELVRLPLFVLLATTELTLRELLASLPVQKDSTETQTIINALFAPQNVASVSEEP